MTDILAHATAIQRQASDPQQSVWVNASAGTGKTKVLIERVLRLLLPRPDGAPGTRADRILCLTYTRAAGAEMTERLIGRCAEWAVWPEEKLAANLTDIFDAPPTPHQLRAARGLFGRMVDGPEKVRIQTIHAFCQSVLARFPLESGLAPQFTLVEGEELDALLTEARAAVFAQAPTNPALAHAIQIIGGRIHSESLNRLIIDLLAKRQQLTRALESHPRDQWPALLARALHIPEDENRESWTEQLQNLSPAIDADLRLLMERLAQGSVAEQSYAEKISLWRANPARADDLPTLFDAFFQKNGDPRSDGAKQGIRKKDDQARAAWTRAQTWAAQQREYARAFDLIDLNLHLLTLGQAVLTAFEAIKRQRHAVDFDDLIRLTARLLRLETDGEHPMAPWVMFKLDGGIDHILVDEAQDTNPEQWEIITSLVNEFARDASETSSRSLFVVGDQKQSIYSFQGADADSFAQSLAHLSGGQAGTGPRLANLPMNVSFRTAAPVLALVDAVFAHPTRARHVRAMDPVTHLVARAGQAGTVELWPLTRPAPKEETAPEFNTGWTLPQLREPAASPLMTLADRIAKTIRTWLDAQEILPSLGRPIAPRDIMILVRKRAPMLPTIISALRACGVPVTGLDRLHLMDSIAVQDIVALINASLSPWDDYALACAFKSPFFGLDEEELMRLALGRSGTLFDALTKRPEMKSHASWLQQKIRLAQTGSGLRFLTNLLYTPCPGDPHGSGERALARRLGADVHELLRDVLQQAQAHESSPGGLQAFIHAITTLNPEVRRAPNGEMDAVRLLTVHGAKGLEAPIVILPDTIPTNRAPRSSGLFWPDQTRAELPLWSPVASTRPTALAPVEQAATDADTAEYDRLLYVALTRPRDRLIVAGAINNLDDPAPEQSWYQAIADGMQHFKNHPIWSEDADGTQRLTTPQQNPPDNAIKPGAHAQEPLDFPPLPDGWRHPLPPEQTPPRPLRPDRASTSAPRSPLLTTADSLGLQRGVLVHKLLQTLPELSPHAQLSTAQQWINQQEINLSPAARTKLVNEVMGVLNHPDNAPFFSAQGRAEVAITGRTPEGRLIAGRIDRLVVTDTTIWVLDYKTGQPPHPLPLAIPSAYLRQMRAYRDLLRGIYPHHQIRPGLLWTEGPTLTLLDDALLDNQQIAA